MKLKTWLTIGPEPDARREVVLDFDKDVPGLTWARWTAMSDDEKEEAARVFAFETLHWGYMIVEDETT